MRRSCLGPTLVVCLLASAAARAEPSKLPPEVGYNYGQPEPPRSAALGGGLRALSNSTDALFLNPANMVTTRVYHLGAAAELSPQAKRQLYSGAVVDSVVNSAGLAGGVGGFWTKQDPDGLDRRALDLRFALAFPLSDQFSVGAAGRFLELSQEGFPRDEAPAPTSAAGGLDGEDIVKDITFDAGVTFKPIEQLALALVGNNLTDPGHGLLPLTFGGGIGYGTKDFSLEADLVGDFTTFGDTKSRVQGGGELLLAGHYPLRGGYRYDEGLNSHSVSFGVGYLAPEFSVELAARRSLGDNGATTVVFGFRYHVDAAGSSDGF